MKLSPFSTFAGLTLFGASTAALALSVTFTQVGEVTPAGAGNYFFGSGFYRDYVAVGNDGTVALTTASNQLVSWNINTGTNLIVEENISGFWPSISASGNVILFSHSGNSHNNHDAYRYENGTLSSYDYQANRYSQSTNFPHLYALSGNGNVMAGNIDFGLGILGSIVSGENISYLSNSSSETEGAIIATNFSGTKFVTHRGLGNLVTPALVWNTDGSYISSETNMAVRDFSADGNTVLGIQKYCNDFGYCVTDEGVLWNVNTNTKTVIEGMNYPEAFSADAGLVVGNYAAQMKIWDAQNGTRNLTQVLENHGVDLSGWSNTKVTDISEDGSKIVGIGENSNGDIRAFIVNIIPECSNLL